jgi:hypothetical protein
MIPPDQCPNKINVQLEPPPCTPAAAKFERPLINNLERTPPAEQCSASLNNSGPVMAEKVILKGTHPLLEMEITPDKDNPTQMHLQSCHPNTPMSKVPRWRGRLQGAHIQSINDVPVHLVQDIKSIIQARSQLRRTAATTQLAMPLAPAMADHGVPQLHLDQLNVIAHHLDAIKQQQAESWPGLPQPTFRPSTMKTLMQRCTKGLQHPE